MGTGPLAPLINAMLPWVYSIMTIYAIIMIVQAGYGSEGNAKKMLQGILCAAIFCSGVPLIKYIIGSF